MKTLFLLLNFICGVLLMAATGFAIGGYSGALVLGSLAFGAGFVQVPKNSLAMALNTEVWLNDIQEKLFSGNEFVRVATNDSVHINNKAIHIPQAGVIQDVIVNPNVYPLPIAERSDEDFTYNMDEIALPPTLVRDAEQAELSYQKRQSILQHKIKKLNAQMGDLALKAWALPDITTGTNAKQYVYTSGAAGTANNPARGAARKKLVVADLHKLMTKVLEQDAFTDGDRLCLMLPPIMLAELREDLDKNNHRLIQERLPVNAIAEYAGFTIFSRSKTPIYSDTDAFSVVAVTSATATDNHAGVAWVESMASYGEGGIEVYEESRSAAYQGDLLSARVRFGASKRRKDGIGLYAIIQQS